MTSVKYRLLCSLVHKAKRLAQLRVATKQDRITPQSLNRSNFTSENVCSNFVVKPSSTVSALRCFSTGVTNPQPMKDWSVPDETWTKEAIEIYDKLNEMTAHPNWVKFPGYASEQKNGNRMFLRATGNKQFKYALFLNMEEKRAMGVITFGPWAEGGKEHVHGGAVSTVLDSIMGVVGNVAVAPSVTANLNVNFIRPLRLEQAVMVSGGVERVDGRKIFLNADITNIDGSVHYVKSTSLFVKTRKRVESEFMNE